MNHAIDDVCVATGRPQEHFWVRANTALSGRSIEEMICPTCRYNDRRASSGTAPSRALPGLR